jgi:hypothetical protein
MERGETALRNGAMKGNDQNAPDNLNISRYVFMRATTW